MLSSFSPAVLRGVYGRVKGEWASKMLSRSDSIRSNINTTLDQLETEDGSTRDEKLSLVNHIRTLRGPVDVPDEQDQALLERVDALVERCDVIR